MQYFKIDRTTYRQINRVEFMGASALLCHAITDDGDAAPALVAEGSGSTLVRAVDITADEWAAAEALAVKRQKKDAEEARFKVDAERYGFKVTIRSARSVGTVAIVRVTTTRYVDVNGGQWIRLPIPSRPAKGNRASGCQVGGDRWSAIWAIDEESMARLEAAISGAERYDFIKAGRAKEGA